MIVIHFCYFYIVDRIYLLIRCLFDFWKMFRLIKVKEFVND